MPLNFNSSLEWERFITALEGVRNTPPLFAAHTHDGPILPIYSIDYSRLDAPVEMKALFRDLVTSGSPVDRSPRKESRNDETLGAMRQIHSNDPKYLPPIGAVTSLSSKATAYQRYVSQYKRHTNDHGGGNELTGYVEYTAGTSSMYNRGNRARIVFDYIHSRVFFSPMHYASWSAPDNSGRRQEIDKPAAGSGHPSPFFLINF